MIERRIRKIGDLMQWHEASEYHPINFTDNEYRVDGKLFNTRTPEFDLALEQEKMWRKLKADNT